jgi:tetratricopeptide (TPR) repeat protein
MYSLQKQAKHTAELLGNFGMQAFREHRYATASQALSLSNELLPNEKYQKVLFAIREIAEQKPVVIVDSPATRPRSYRIDKRYSNAGLLFDVALANENWTEAKKQLDRLIDIKPNSKTNQRYINEYNEAIKPYISQLIQDGEQHYSKGEFNPALTTWEKGIVLDPENKELEKRILRAEQVLQNLKELSGRPPSIRFPVKQENPTAN